MPPISDDAVVLTRLDYQETSQVLVFFTREHGKLRAIGKGTKRGTKTRFATGIDLLEIGRIVCSARPDRGPTLSTLTEWKQTRPLSGLRESLPRLYGAQYIAEITTYLTEDWDPHPRAFDAMITAWVQLSEALETLGIIVGYQRVLLDEIGSLPRFDACVLCGRERDLTHFSSHEGGMICRHCEPGHVEKRQLSSATLAILRESPDDPASGPHGNRTERYRGPFDILNYHISHLMAREPMLAAKILPASERRILR